MAPTTEPTQEPQAKRIKLDTAGPDGASAVPTTLPAPLVPSTAHGAAPPLKRPFVCSAHDAVSLRLVRSVQPEQLASEIDSGGEEFKAEFLHQHFGDDEEIKGYTDLKITIWLHALTYHAWIDIKYATRRPGADKLKKVFDQSFPAGYSEAKEEFIKQVVEAAAQVSDLYNAGDDAGTAAVRNSGSSAGENPIRIRRFPLGEGADPAIRALHMRLQPLLLFFIDGASFIDEDDPQWEVLLPVQKTDQGCIVLGLCTLYTFWSYPSACRSRLSQILVLPTFQRSGAGKALLAGAYQQACSRRFADLTIEDPTPNLQRVREKLEVEMLRQQPWVMRQAMKCIDAVEANGSAALWPVDELHAADGAAHSSPAGLPVADAGAASATADQLADQLASASYFSVVLAPGQQPDARVAVPERILQETEEQRRQRVEGSAVSVATAGAAVSPAVDGGGDAHTATPAGDALAELRVVAPGGSKGKALVEGSGGSGAAAGVVMRAGAAAGSSGVCGALVPSPAFASAVAGSLKIHKGEVRCAWEALLWSLPGALERPRVRAALTATIQQRLDVVHFGQTAADSAAKKVVDVDRKQVSEKWFMYRVRASKGGDLAGTSAASAAMATTVGRGSVHEVDAAEKVVRLQELLQERLANLDTLRGLVNGAGSSQPQGAKAQAVGAA